MSNMRGYYEFKKEYCISKEYLCIEYFGKNLQTVYYQPGRWIAVDSGRYEFMEINNWVMRQTMFVVPCTKVNRLFFFLVVS